MLEERQRNQEQVSKNSDSVISHIDELIGIAQSNDIVNIVSVVEIVDTEGDTTLYRMFGNGSTAQTIGLLDVGQMLASDILYGDAEDDIS